MRILECNVKVAVKFSWLKYVTGSNIKEHCAKSLVGTYEQRINRWGQPNCAGLVLPESPFYYFCCVTNQYKTNVHVAWREAKGKTMVVENELVRMVVEDAEQLPIDNRSIYRELHVSQDWHYSTCRNWWFASWLKRQGF